MAKDVNIHLKTTGSERTKQDLGQVAAGTRKIGTTAGQAGEKAKTGLGRFMGAIKGLVGAAGIAAVVAIVGRLSKKVAEFFDGVSTKADEAVRHIQGLRDEYESLFEALGAYDEKSRTSATERVNILLQETSVTKKTGLPIIDAYTRQFRSLVGTGQLTQEEYDRGLKGMLRYGQIHGGEATPDLISMMSGWGQTKPEEQGKLRRQIAEAAGAVGLTDAQVIGALSRGMPAIKAMRWSPAYAVEAISTIAAGEAGRKRMSLPGTTLSAIMAPQEEKFAEYGLDPRLAEQPQELLSQLQKMADAGKARRLKAGLKKGAPPEYEDVEILTLLKDIYGIEASAGVHKLLTARNEQLAEVLQVAASAEGAEAERTQWGQYATTLEARDARTKAQKRRIELEVTQKEKTMEDVREIGAEAQKLYRRREPVTQWLREFFTWGGEKEKEEAARIYWERQLSEEEQRDIINEFRQTPIGYYGRGMEEYSPSQRKWRTMSPQQKWEALTTVNPPPPAEAIPLQPQPEAAGLAPSPPQSNGPPVTQNFDHRVINQTIFNPFVGMNKQDLRIEPPYLG